MEVVVGKNLRNEQRLALKQANIRWANCVADKFLPNWLNGQNLDVKEVCREELDTMKELDSAQYPELPLAF